MVNKLDKKLVIINVDASNIQELQAINDVASEFFEGSAYIPLVVNSGITAEIVDPRLRLRVFRRIALSLESSLRETINKCLLDISVAQALSRKSMVEQRDDATCYLLQAIKYLGE